MTKAEIEIELIHAIHYLSFEEMQDILKNVLTRIKKEPLELTKDKDNSINQFQTYQAENDINVWQNLSPELDAEQQEWEW